MSKITLTAADGFEFNAYNAQPQDVRRAGLVILHALWGVTPHIRELADSYAADGYEVLAPSLFDRFERGFAEANITPEEQPTRDEWARTVGWGAGCMPDIQAAIDALADKGPVFVMGFCFGGTATWLAACRAERIAAAACFYGGQIVLYKDETPKCPTILHFGKSDPFIPEADREAIIEAHPDIPAFLYDAGHAFVAPNAYHEDSAKLSRLRTLQLFARGGGRGEA